jgi:lysophospholipase L1-like esterase
MSRGQKFVFSLVTLVLFFGVIEAVAWTAWLALESRAPQVRTAKGEESLAANSIRFQLKTDPVLGYILRPNAPENGVNAAGFAQLNDVPVARTPGVLRIATMGESTTQGHGADTGNYPAYLGRLLQSPTIGGQRVEVINAGVSGWVSDQVALWAEHKVAAYKPDVVIFYTGWNDFQAYSPFSVPGPISYFQVAFGNPYRVESDFPIKTVVFAIAAYEAMTRKPFAPPVQLTPSAEGYVQSAQENYRYLFASLDRAIAALRRANPDVKIVISTIVGRWPEGGREEFDKPNGHTWWMKDRIDPQQAATAMERFNEAIRTYARARAVVLIDPARVLSGTDRRRLQWDFAHFSDEGYELLANTIYSELLRQQVVKGAPSPRMTELMSKYAKAQ